MENKKKIYLSGKISGDPNFKEKFAQKEKELTEMGYHVFNPATHPDMFTWEQFMELDLKALGHCDAIYLLDDWKDSRGAKIEYDEAVKLGKEVLFEEKRDIDNSIKAEIQEVKSYKFRVVLEDGSLTPWQYADHNPTKNDLEDVKNYYTNLAEKKRLEQSEILQSYKEKGMKQEQERKGVSLEQKLSSYRQSIWNDYISAVRAFLPKDKLSDRKAVLEASKHALAVQVDVSGAIEIINNEFSMRGVKNRATLVKAIKEAAYPELSKEQENKKSIDDDFGHGR